MRLRRGRWESGRRLRFWGFPRGKGGGYWQLILSFSSPFSLPADHYFFIPQVQVTGGDFFWLSAPKPVVVPGTPFTPDLQGWIRNANLDLDWLRIGTDIVGGTTPPTFNAAFSLTGTVPEPATMLLLGTGLIGLWGARRKLKK